MKKFLGVLALLAIFATALTVVIAREKKGERMKKRGQIMEKKGKERRREATENASAKMEMKSETVKAKVNRIREAREATAGKGGTKPKKRRR